MGLKGEENSHKYRKESDHGQALSTRLSEILNYCCIISVGKLGFITLK